MPYIQLSISYRYDESTAAISESDLSDWLVATLSELDFDSFEQEAYLLKAFVEESLYDEAATREALTSLPVAGFTYELQAELLPEVDWNEEWEKNYFQPLLLGEGRLLVRAPFHAPQPEVPQEIIISPKMAFGTGNHETTSLVASWLLDHDLRGLRVLDMGCGTGILGLIALRQGASYLTAIDIDPWSYANVQENAALNALHIDEMICGDASALAGRGGYDLVLANITRNILMADLPQYASSMAPGARILLSGFYAEDAPLLIQRGQELGLSPVSQVERNRWTLLELVKEN